MKNAKVRKRSFKMRTVVQLVFFILIAAIAVNHTLAAYGVSIPLLSSASLHAVCPFGGVVSVYQFLTSGTFVRKIHEAALVLGGLVLLLALFFGPVFCGWICPFGSIQEWFGKLGRKLSGRRFNRFIPYKVDRYLRFLRYGVLAWVVYMTAVSGTLVFEAADPYYVLFNLWTGEIALTGYIVLAAVLLASLFVERPFCKYACPYGAFLGVTNLFRVFGIRRNSSGCISCGACDRTCPMNIPVSAAKTVRSHQCIGCLECTSEYACPVPATVELAAGRTGAGDRVKEKSGAAVQKHVNLGHEERGLV